MTAGCFSTMAPASFRYISPATSESVNGTQVFFFNFSFLIFVKQNNYDMRILEFCEREWRRILANFGFRIAGMYVMVVGGFVIRTDDIPVIKVNSHISLHIFSINFGLKFDISFGSV